MKHHNMTYGEVKLQFHSFPSLAVHGNVINFKPRPLYFRIESPWYTMDKRLSIPQFLSRHCEEEKNSCPARNQNLGHPACSPIAIPADIKLVC
jgi:hypothetical protein